MRVARIARNGGAEYAVARLDGGWVSLSAHGIDQGSSGELIEALPAIREVLESSSATEEIGPECFLSPVVNPILSLAIGRNYLLHARERGAEAPKAPMMFAKLPGSFIGAREEVTVDPALTSQLDYEVELVVLIGKTASRVSIENALDHVAGYLVGNDLSARDCQQSDKQFDRAKGMDGFGPLGPWITTVDEVSDPQNLELWSTVNGEVRQQANTEQMMFPVAFLISYLSTGIALHPGDVIWTGTPHGVGAGLGEHGVFLAHGDVVACGIEGLGEVKNRILMRGMA